MGTTLPPLHQSPGNLFPGPSRQSRPWPAQHCWLRFPYFLVFSSPLPQAPLPALSPSPPPPELEPVRGRIGKGPEKGSGAAGWAAPGLGGSEESPLAQGQDEVWFNLLPSLPQGWLGADQKDRMTHLPGCSPAFLPLFRALGMFFPDVNASWNPALPPGLILGHLFHSLTRDSGSLLKVAQLLLCYFWTSQDSHFGAFPHVVPLHLECLSSFLLDPSGLWAEAHHPDSQSV